MDFVLVSLHAAGQLEKKKKKKKKKKCEGPIGSDWMFVMVSL